MVMGNTVLGLSSVDAGDGWLIFALPPSEVAVHPADDNDVHEFYLMSDDVAALTAALRKRGTPCSAIQDRGWGLLTQVTLPGGGSLGIYEPRHARPAASGRRTTARPAASRAARTTGKAGKRGTKSGRR